MDTLKDVLKALFPGLGASKNPFTNVPLLPADLFAYTGHVLERSGAYHHVTPQVGEHSDGWRKVLVDNQTRQYAIDVGRKWRTGVPTGNDRLPPVPDEVAQLWSELSQHQSEEVFVALDDEANSPEWWDICLKLLMVADEASLNVGFDENNPFSRFVDDAYAFEDRIGGSTFGRIQKAPFSFSFAAQDLVCVQPKSRTPTVGCTLRSLSHHLALLPPRGQVRARWVKSPFKQSASSDDDKLGLLLVPFPYRIGNDSFLPAGEETSGGWGWFDAHQTWLPKDTDKTKRKSFVKFVVDLVERARAKGQRVNGIVLPELALNYLQFVGLARVLAQDNQIDFLISGISTDRNARGGNFVAIAPFFLMGNERKDKIRNWENLILVREKHHRWKLNEAQINSYGLGLDTTKSWWEKINILSRSLDVLVYRDRTTLTTLICEDLARVDPCQAVVRAIGPNLLIALLMDGPQLSARWPGRYATVLAEDPGTSVLSFTSFGLIARQNDIGAFGQATTIALWKDEVKGAQSIDLPRDADAVVVQLRSVAKTEHTLDGRSDEQSSHRWQYESQIGIGVGNNKRPAWISSGSGRYR